MARKGKRTDLNAWLEAHRPMRIGEEEWTTLLAALTPVSVSYLRRLIRETGLPLAPMVEGVRQETLEALEASLLALLVEYEAGDAPRKRLVRNLVIEAKDHAKFAARKHPEKQEMILWMLTWLENPPLFPNWVTLRKAGAH